MFRLTGGLTVTHTCRTVGESKVVIVQPGGAEDRARGRRTHASAIDRTFWLACAMDASADDVHSRTWFRRLENTANPLCCLTFRYPVDLRVDDHNRACRNHTLNRPLSASARPSASPAIGFVDAAADGRIHPSRAPAVVEERALDRGAPWIGAVCRASGAEPVRRFLFKRHREHVRSGPGSSSIGWVSISARGMTVRLDGEMGADRIAEIASALRGLR